MALVACCLWCAPASSAHLLQDTFPAELELVAVPVFVTDDRGQSVPGLTAADFTIEDEGERVPIRAFVAVDSTSPALARAPGGAPGLRAAAHRQFLLLFDLTFSTPSGVARARDGALAFLEKGLAPNDLVAVATLRPTGVQLLVGFTPDVRQAVRAVAHLHAAGEGGLRDPLGLARDLGVKLTGLTSFQGLPPENDPAWETVPRDRFLQELRANREAYGRRVIGFLSALGELGQLLGALEGRKQIILFSAGYDQTVLSGVEHAERVESSRATLLGRLWEVQPEAHFGDHRALSNLDRLMDGFGASDVVVHTVDVTGLSAAGDPSGIEQVRRASGAGSLSQLAKDSGGRFIRNANDLARGLGQILDASRFFYVVGFEPRPGSKHADESRRLDISVARPALHVSHRRGYVLDDERGRSVPARRLQAAEAIAKGLSTGAIGLGLMAMPYHRKGVGPELPVVLQVDGRSLLDGRAGESLEMEVYGYALDESGRILDAIGLRPTLDLSRVGGTVQETGVQVLTSFRVAAGPVSLRFLVLDPATDRRGSLSTEQQVPVFGGDDPWVLSAPLVTSDPQERVVIPSPSLANPQLEIPFRMGDVAFTVEVAPVLRNGRAIEACLIVSSSAPMDDARMSAVLSRPSEPPLDVSVADLRAAGDRDNFTRYCATLEPERVREGTYDLNLRLAFAGGSRLSPPVQVRIE